MVSHILRFSFIQKLTIRLEAKELIGVREIKIDAK